MTFPKGIKTSQAGVFYEKELGEKFRIQSGAVISTRPSIIVPAKLYYRWNELFILGGLELWLNEFDSSDLGLALGLQVPINNKWSFEFQATQFIEGSSVISIRYQRKFNTKKKST